MFQASLYQEMPGIRTQPGDPGTLGTIGPPMTDPTGVSPTSGDTDVCPNTTIAGSFDVGGVEEETMNATIVTQCEDGPVMVSKI